MPESINRYTTWELDAMVSNVDPSFSFLADTFFPGERQFTGDFIEFDIVEHGRHMAPFVSPLVQGQPTRRHGYRTFQLKPAYIKMSHKVTPGDGYSRRAGEAYGGSLTPMQRLDLAMAEQIAIHDDMINNRLEWMAASALVNGTIVVTGPDYPAQTVSFERNSNLSNTVGVAWATTTTATPIDDLQTMADRINLYSRGSVMDTVVMGGAAYSNATKNSQFRDLLDRDKNLSPGTRFDAGPRSGTREAVYQGRLSGKWDLWTYDGYYEDDSGVSTRFVAADKVICACRGGIEGSKLFGAIQDMEAGMQPMRHYVKSRTTWDPSAEECLSQSAPMINVKRPNCTAVLDVTP
jgi:hypothetical protein